MKKSLLFALIVGLSVFSCTNTKKENQSNHEETKTQELISSEIQESSTSAAVEKSTSQNAGLHKSIRSFRKNMKIIKTKKFLVRIDEMSDGSYRYASWSIDSDMNQKPDLVINKGELIREGTGGNHRFEFTKSDFKYICDMNVLAEDGAPDAFLRVMKDGKEIVNQGGTLVNNTTTENTIPKNSITQLDPSKSSYDEQLGNILLAEESFGDLKIDTPIKDVIKMLGKPEKVEAPMLSDATGEYMGFIAYPSKGIGLSTNGKEGNKTVSGIFISKPCTLKTSKNIGIGSTKESLVVAYKPHLKPDQYIDKEEMILGTMYGGMIVKFKNDIVTEISLGVFAE